MELFVVGKNDEEILRDIDRLVVEYKACYEMMEKVDWIVSDWIVVVPFG